MKKILFTLFLGLSTFTITAQKELTLEDAVLNQYRAYYPENTVMVQWIPNTQNYSYLSADYQTLLLGNTKNGKIIELIKTSEVNVITGQKMSWLNVLGWENSNEFYVKAGKNYYKINLEQKSSIRLNTVPTSPVKIENEDFNPLIKSTAYTVDNNLFIGTPKGEKVVTSFESNIVSGQAIARSEFGISGGTFWSPQGTYLAFYQKDESNVADYPLLDVNTTPGKLNSIKYPMAGQKSEKSKVGIYNIERSSTVYISPKGNPEDYLTNVSWGPNENFIYVAEVNRDQNHMQLQKYDASGKFIATLFEEKSDKWTEPEHPVYFVTDNLFIWMSERDGFMNLYLYDSEGKLVKQLTSNKWVAQEIIGHDTRGNVYFKGTGESPLETNCFKVNIKSGNQSRLTEAAGTHNVSFSSDFNYMYDSYSSRTVPNKEIIWNISKKIKMSREVLTAINPYGDIKMGTAEYGTIKAADKTTDLHYRLIKPSNFDENKKYPVLVYVYGGPHAQMVTNSWLGGASLWMYWMAEQGYLVYTVDNRGSGNRGFEFESVIHRNLGDAEMNDQLKGVEFLKSKSFVDGKRIAVHGWSFGGFMTTSLMLRYPEVFTTGIAGGPVTDWKYYEIMYGERYMDRPKQNIEGYKKAALENYVDKLEGKLLLIHGTSDDVVVMQHNLSLVQAFVEAGVQMDFFPYPMHKHNVRGKDRVHLMTKVLNYVIENNK
jgi:dipeptidyl-peptidase-4